MKKISVLGHEGKLGSELVRLGCVPLCADITEPTDLREAIAVVNPDVIINCAAVTDVDACEEVLQPMANLVNSLGVANLRDAFHGRIIQISTDFVFNGRNGPYKENDIPFPISHYGSTKLDGEKYILNSFWPGTIIRTTILYGKHGKKDFVSGILEALKGTKRR